MIKRVFLSCLLAYSSITFAANVDYHKEFDKCTNDKQNIEVLGRNLTGGCASLVVDDTKKEMNKIYQKISSKKAKMKIGWRNLIPRKKHGLHFAKQSAIFKVWNFILPMNA